MTWAIWFGILTGCLELLNLGLKKHVLGGAVLLGGHTLWMAPLADGALFLILGATFVPLALLLPARFAERAAVFAFCFTLTASLVFLHRQIHNYAAALLSAGVAVQTVRSISARAERFDSLVRCTLPWMVAACLTAAVVLPTWRAWTERRAIRALASVPLGSPNVLLIVWDTVRSKSLSTYGYDRQTSPNLTRAGEEGIVFEHAVAPSPWTLPSHASLFTGRWADELSATWEYPLDDASLTLAEALGAKGYATAGFVANQALCSRVHGLDRGFLHYEDFNVLGTEFVLSCQLGRRLTTSPRLRRWIGWKDFWGRKSAERIDRDFLRWIDGRPDRPFFAFLNYYDAHQPYYAPAPLDERFGPREWREGIAFYVQQRHADPVLPYVLTDRQHQGSQDAYDGSIAYLDACLGNLLEDLEERGLLENTLVIVTSDHGEQFGEHGLYDHRNSLYRPLLHVPLVMRLPGGVPSGRRASQVVSLRDLPATVIDLVGCTGAREFPGSSLRQCWTGTEPDDSHEAPLWACLRPPYYSPHTGDHLDAMIVDGLYYIRFADGREKLFDFLHDPLESADLSSAEDMHDVLSHLRALAARRLGKPSTDLAGARQVGDRPGLRAARTGRSRSEMREGVATQ